MGDGVIFQLEAIPCGSVIRKVGKDRMFQMKMMVVQVRLKVIIWQES